MKLIDALSLKTLSRAQVVAGASSLERAIRWVHVVDLPEPLPWLRTGDLMLTTGYSWPREESAQRELIAALAELGLAGLGFAVPNFFERIPSATREAAEEHHLPLLEIPWEIPFSSITEEMHGAIIATQYEMLEQSESIHSELMRTALEADTLQDIAAMLGSLIGRSLFIAQPDGNVLASYASPNEQLNVNPARSDGFTGILPKDRRSLLKSLRLDTPLRIPPNIDSGTPAQSVWPISIKRELIGLLWILEGESPLTELEVRAADHSTLIMAMHLSWQKQLASLESQLGFSFLESLQEGNFHPTVQMVERAEILGFDPEGTYRMGLMVLKLSVPLSPEGILKRERFVERLRRNMKELGIPPLLSFAQNQISFLIPEESNARQIWESFQAEQSISFAVSRPYIGFDGAQKGFREVCSMLPHLTPGHYYDYEDLLVPRVLLGEQEARELFLEKMFKPFNQIRNGEILIETLVETARNGFHLKHTAETLCIHPKTLRYRLDKVVSLGGYDFDDAETRFNLQLAARILSLKDKK